MGNKIQFREMPTGYGMIQTAVMKCKISIQAKAVYALLASYTGANEFCWPRIKTMVDDLNIGKKMIIKYLNELEQAGLIKRDRLDKKDPFNRRNKYKIYYIKTAREANNDGNQEGTIQDNYRVPTIYNNINNYNNKNKDIESTDKSVDKGQKPLKSSLNKKSKSPIEDNKDFMELLEMWNSFPLTTKHASTSTKTISDAYKWYRRLLDGSFFRNASTITAAWLTEIGAELDIQSKQFTHKEIKEGVKRLGLQYQEGYWPYTVEEKKKFLPKSLLTSFYSPYNRACPSAFLKVFIKEPVGQAELTPIEKGKYDQYFDIYEQCQVNIKEKDKARVVRHIKTILFVQECICDVEIKLFAGGKKRRAEVECELGTGFEYVAGNKSAPDNFVHMHAKFLKSCEREWNAFKITPSTFSANGKLWDNFIEWVKATYKVELWLSDEGEQSLAMRYENYIKHKKNKSNKSVDVKERIKELKLIIKKEKSADVRILFEDEIKQLQEKLKTKKEAV